MLTNDTVAKTLEQLGNTLSFREPQKDLAIIYDSLQKLGLFKLFKPYYSFDDTAKSKHTVVIKYLLKATDTKPYIAQLNF